MNTTRIKIVSGGQTGADRAALDAALAAEVACGGWCPQGRLAENGILPPQYPLTELRNAGYTERTRQNVIDSDGTLIVSFGPPDEGTALTLRCCQAAQKPTLFIDASGMSIETGVKELIAFVGWHRIHTLNVAGPRASKQPGIYQFVLELVGNFLASLKAPGRDQEL